MNRTTVPLLLCVGVAGCAAPAAIGAGPKVTPEQRDALQRAATRPQAEVDASFETSVAETDVALSVDDYCRISHALPLEKILEGVNGIPRVAGTEPLTPTWGENGARRRVLLEDGNSALEEIVSYECPGRFRYVVWNYTSDAAKYVDHAVGQFEVTPAAVGTHVKWSYSFEPRGWPATWLLGSFVHGDYHEWMVHNLEVSRAAITGAAAAEAR